MNSQEYRLIISRIIRNAVKQHFPGLKAKELEAAGALAARSIHARMYGANVDGVDSPIWAIDQHGTDRVNDPRTKPNVDAKELLNGD